MYEQDFLPEKVPLRELGDFYLFEDSQIQIITWTPDPHGRRVPGEQVNIVMSIDEETHIVIRLKSYAAVESFIEALRTEQSTAMWE